MFPLTVLFFNLLNFVDNNLYILIFGANSQRHRNMNFLVFVEYLKNWMQKYCL